MLRDSVDGLVAALAEVITRPALHDWEVSEAKAALGAYVATQLADPRTALLEALHAAAFGATSPLGHSVLATPAALDSLDADALRAFLGARFAADKIVIAATSAWEQRDEDAACFALTRTKMNAMMRRMPLALRGLCRILFVRLLPPPTPASPFSHAQMSTTPHLPPSWTSIL